MFDQTLSNLIVCLMISHKNNIQKLHKRASMLQWILGRFDFSQNEFEMRLAKKVFALSVQQFVVRQIITIYFRHLIAQVTKERQNGLAEIAPPTVRG